MASRFGLIPNSGYPGIRPEALVLVTSTAPVRRAVAAMKRSALTRLAIP
jgi:hypothetical protein